MVIRRAFKVLEPAIWALRDKPLQSTISSRFDDKKLDRPKAPAALARARYGTIPVLMAVLMMPFASAAVSVRVSPSTLSIGSGGSQTFTAKVVGTNNGSVTWSLTPQLGSIVNGVYS